MKTREKQKELILKVLALFVGLSSLGFGVFSSIKSKGHKDANTLFKIEIARKSAELIHAELQIWNQHKIIDSFQHIIDSLIVEREKNQIIEDSLKNVLASNSLIIESLKTSLHEINHLPVLSPDKHIELFLQWTNPTGHSNNIEP